MSLENENTNDAITLCQPRRMFARAPGGQRAPLKPTHRTSDDVTRRNLPRTSGCRVASPDQRDRAYASDNWRYCFQMPTNNTSLDRQRRLAAIDSRTATVFRPFVIDEQIQPIEISWR